MYLRDYGRSAKNPLDFPRMAIPNRPPQRVSPTQAPAEALERVRGRRALVPELGDILIVRESAGSPGSIGSWRYCLRVEPGEEPIRYFSRYAAAAMEGEQLAVTRKVRLFYNEDASCVLLMDYRSDAKQAQS